MTRVGAGFNTSTQAWIRYGALVLLALFAFGASAVALTRSTSSGKAGDPVAVSPPATTPTSSAALTPTATATATQAGIQLPAEPVLLIVGDSYTAGVGAEPPGQGWAYLVARTLGYPNNVNGVPGSGFVWGGGLQDSLAFEYEVRLQEIAANRAFVPNVLILQGGQDDFLNSPAEIESATARTIELARRLWPGVQVLVLGPSAPQPLAEELRGANTAVRAGAAAANAPFVDAHEAGWFTDANSPGFNFNGSHVNTFGHAHIAGKFLESWAALIQ